MRSRALSSAAVLAFIAALSLAQLRSALVQVPFAPETTAVDLTLMVPIVPVLIFAASYSSPLGRLERLHPRSMTTLRLVHVVLVLTVAELSAFGSLGRPWQENAAVGLNALLLVGIALAATVVSDGSLPWAAPLMVVALCFFFGTSTETGTAYHWAVLLAGPTPLAAVSAGVTATVGVLAFVVRGPRTFRLS